MKLVIASSYACVYAPMCVGFYAVLQYESYINRPGRLVMLRSTQSK